MNRKSREVKGLTPLGRKWVIAASNDMRRRLGLNKVRHYKKRRKTKRRNTKRRKQREEKRREEKQREEKRREKYLNLKEDKYLFIFDD